LGRDTSVGPRSMGPGFFPGFRAAPAPSTPARFFPRSVEQRALKEGRAGSRRRVRPTFTTLSAPSPGKMPGMTIGSQSAYGARPRWNPLPGHGPKRPALFPPRPQNRRRKPVFPRPPPPPPTGDQVLPGFETTIDGNMSSPKPSTKTLNRSGSCFDAGPPSRTVFFFLHPVIHEAGAGPPGVGV